MEQFPASFSAQPSRTVAPNAPRPTATILAKMVMALLSAYFQSDQEDPEMFSARVEAFKVALMDLPKDAIALAIETRLKSPDRRRPIPGEIREQALKFIRFSSKPVLSVVEDAPKEQITAEQARRVVDELGGGKIAESMLRAIESAEGPGRRLSDALEVVALHFGTTEAALKGEVRDARTSAARFAFYLLGRDEIGASYPAIGKVVNRDHTTVIHGAGRAKDMMTEPSFLASYNQCRTDLR